MKVKHTILLCSALLGSTAGYSQQPMPGMPGMDHGDPATPAQSKPERPARQQGGQPGPAEDAGSLTRDAAHLQEPENPDFHTGTDTPAPLLLGAISQRAPLPLQAFLDAAEKHSPALRQSSALVRERLQGARQAGLYPNPQVGYGGEQIRGGSYGGGEQGLFVQQTVVLGGKLQARGEIYRQQAKSDLFGVEEQHFRIRADVMQAFYETLTAQAIVVERQRLLGVAEDALATAHQLANAGQADAPDVLMAGVEAEQAKIDFLAAQREFLANFEVLAADTGQPELPPAPLAGELDKPPVFDGDARVEELVQNSPTVKRAEQEVLVAEARLHDAKREAIPDLQLRAGEQENREALVAGSPGRAPVRVGPQSFASAAVSLPLWNRNQGNIEAAKAEVERAREDVVRTRLLLKRQAEPLAQLYQTAQFEADRYRDELIPRARRAYELYLTKYQQMAAGYSQALLAQRTLFQLQISYLESLQTVWTTSTALGNYTLEGGLTPSMQSGQDLTSPNPPNGAPQ